MQKLIALFLTILLIACLIPPTAEETPPPSVVETEVVETIPPSPEPVEEPQPWTEEEVIVLAKMVWGEARGVPSDTEKAACVWCALNRVDQGYGSIVMVVTAPYQFVGYHEDNPVEDTLKSLCENVLARWYAEKDGRADVGRVLPSDYLWFSGDGRRNHFRNAYRGGDRWDWSLPSPYES